MSDREAGGRERSGPGLAGGAGAKRRATESSGDSVKERQSRKCQGQRTKDQSTMPNDQGRGTGRLRPQAEIEKQTEDRGRAGGQANPWVEEGSVYRRRSAR
jgi:hypothetical protein